MTLRDLYKKHHWQVAGPTFYQLHLLFDKHFGEQSELVDTIAERIMMLGGVSIAMAADVAEMTLDPAPAEGPRGSARADLAPAPRPRDHPRRGPHAWPASPPTRTTTARTTSGEQHHPHERDAGLVRRRTRRRHAARSRRRTIESATGRACAAVVALHPLKSPATISLAASVCASRYGFRAAFCETPPIANAANSRKSSPHEPVAQLVEQRTFKAI